MYFFDTITYVTFNNKFPDLFFLACFVFMFGLGKKQGVSPC